MSVMHVVLVSQLDDMHAKWNKPTRFDHLASPKGGEIRIPMGKTHAPKIRNFISCYKKEKAMKSSLKSKENFNKNGIKPYTFPCWKFCNLRLTKAQWSKMDHKIL